MSGTLCSYSKSSSKAIVDFTTQAEFSADIQIGQIISNLRVPSESCVRNNETEN